MNILAIHNSYQQPGGEDEVYRLETQLLESNGHRVVRYHEHNDAVKHRGLVELLTDTIWNRWSYRQLRTLIREGQIDLMHVHNSFPLISPACYYAAAAEDVPVVQTLHNYRLLCPSATFFRNGNVCERCLGKSTPWPAVVHSCYRDSRLASIATAAMLTSHNLLGTYQNKISAFIALTAFARDKFIQGGLPAAKIFIKPNFLSDDPGAGSGHGEFALFSGRLAEEKGVATLLNAWRSIGSTLPLEIIGDGPLSEQVAAAARENPAIRWHGWQPREFVLERMRAAKAVILPSTWFEPFGMIVVEAFASGTPVIASDIGSLASLIEHGETGLHFVPGDADSLTQQVLLLQANPELARSMRRHARNVYLNSYTGARNYSELMAIYKRVLRGRSPAAVGPSFATSVR